VSAHPLREFHRRSLGMSLLLLVEDYETRMLAAYREQGFADVMRSHGAVLRYVGEQGARISDIAARAGVTKQSIGRIVRDVERLGYVTVSPGDADRRVRHVKFSPRGQALVNASRAIVTETRAVYAQRMGRRVFSELERSLQRSVQALALDLSFLEDTSHASRFYHFGRMLVEVSNDFQARLLAALPVDARSWVGPATLILLSRLPMEGASVTGLARGLPVTVQAVSFSVKMLHSRGVLDVRSHDTDSRAKSVRLGAEGELLIRQLNTATAALWADYAAVLGADVLVRQQQLLGELLSSLERDGNVEAVSA